ncbi:DUF1573 domain-containing protein [Lutibacter maritimus]|uniref:DUF1573 domain-containing protein n=1 Tax=Lutibacter maritimus TaxID=593133 RepID=A0A1I6NQ56_9FLAO|nr:DUF1573 domain-containing protein [Lutibacter maritimus]SFS30086.1 Protein of unknown function [Lutibacter maritimus]
MRKITILSAVLVCIAFISCKENATAKIDAANLETAKERDAKISLGSAIMEFDTMEYDFGTIVEGEIIDGAFKVTNKGKTDLLITAVRPSCGCTTPDWTKDPIKPGETGEIKFSFNSNGRVGKQHKSITITSNAEKITETVRLTGTVTAKS